MNRWITREGRYRESPAIDTFLAEIEAVCQKHGLSISHEDSNGSFVIEDYNKGAQYVLYDAVDDSSRG